MPAVGDSFNTHSKMEVKIDISDNDISKMPVDAESCDDKEAKGDDLDDQQKQEDASTTAPEEASGANGGSGSTASAEAPPKEDAKYDKILAAFPLLLNDEIFLSYEELSKLEVYSVDPEELEPVGAPCPYQDANNKKQPQ